MRKLLLPWLFTLTQMISQFELEVRFFSADELVKHSKEHAASISSSVLSEHLLCRKANFCACACWVQPGLSSSNNVWSCALDNMLPMADLKLMFSIPRGLFLFMSCLLVRVGVEEWSGVKASSVSSSTEDLVLLLPLPECSCDILHAGQRQRSCGLGSRTQHSTS